MPPVYENGVKGNYKIEVTASSGAEVKLYPDVDYAVYRTIPKGEVVECDEKIVTDDASFFRVKNKYQYICGRYKDKWYVRDYKEENNKPTNTEPPKVNNSTPSANTSFESNFSSGTSSGSEAVEPIIVGPQTSIFSGPDEPESYKLDYSWINDSIDVIRRNHNIYVVGDNTPMNNHFQRFKRFEVEFPDIALDKTFAHVFFTRPDLNIMQDNKLVDQVKDDPNVYYLKKSKPEILKMLSQTCGDRHGFNTYLSNKAASFQVSDEFIKTTEVGESFTGHKISIGKSNIESRVASSFSINFVDDKELNVYRMHKIWVDYISKVYRGEWNPKSEYIKDRILDYAVSAYYILTAGDGETILFWSKYTGVYPTNIPSSNLSWTKGNTITNPEYSITYQYSFKEDFNPFSLVEFNYNGSKTGYDNNNNYNYNTIYEKEIMGTGRAFAGVPFIDFLPDSKITGDYHARLRFRTL